MYGEDTEKIQVTKNELIIRAVLLYLRTMQ